METRQFHAWLRDFAQAASLPDPDRLVADGLIRVDGMDMLIYHDESFPDILQLRIDFGPVPETHPKDQLFNALLAANFVFAGVCAFSVHPEAQHVVLTLQQPLDPYMTGTILMGNLQDSAIQAKQSWEQVLDSLSNPPSENLSAQHIVRM